jgi:hypothetical protein
MDHPMLEQIKQKVNELALKINADVSKSVAYGYNYYEIPIIEVDNIGIFSYVISERGKEQSLRAFSKMDDLLYVIFSDITSSIASDFECKNRKEEQDFRRIWFAKLEELMGILNPEWQIRKKAEHDFLLERHPFQD